MPLSAEEIASVVRELGDVLPGSRVEKVHQRDGHSIILVLKPLRQRRGEDPSPVPEEVPFEAAEVEADGASDASPPPFDPLRRLFILLSSSPCFERVHLLGGRGSVRDAQEPFFLALRLRLKGARLRKVRQPGRLRAVEMDFDAVRGSGPLGGSRPPAPERLILVAELAGPRANLILLEGNRRLVASLAPVGRAWERLSEGDRYAPEGPEPHPSAMAGVAASPWRYLPMEEGGGAPEALDRLFPLNMALGRYYGGLEAQALLDDGRTALLKRIAQALARRRILVTKIEGDLEGARQGASGLRIGELLKAELSRMKKGMDRVEVVDYYDPALPRITVALDPARNPLENVERYFQKYRKAQRAIPIIAERMAGVQKEITALEEAAGACPGAQGQEALAAIEERCARLLGRTGKRGPGGPGAAVPSALGPSAFGPSASGPRRFLSRDGLEILVGRSARENDALTFRQARGNDIFLHVSGRPGAHVILRTEKGKPPSLESLLDAAQVALYYSLPVRSHAQILLGAAAEVDYVEVKHVRKPRGAKPGQVLLANHRTLKVAIDKDRLERLRRGLPGGP